MHGRQRTTRMTVGELSRRTGVPVKTLREYTDLGLIYTLGRSPANYRLYDTEALWCLRWIGELRGLGLTVAEIRELTRAWRTGDGQPTGRRLAQLLDRSRERLTQRIAAQQQTLRLDRGIRGRPPGRPGGRRLLLGR
ncbi:MULTISPECIES: MerR family transcriptional regulator [unclassified Streptomyces]|uniref:MerR family transcriptional regulator n=1 Tax=unclassified Streptomyces TaxID=2593676 RepID=UPI001F1140D1|nr:MULTISPECIES: MerR family transcriptional regulator [unclassified Streptomyces]